MSWYIRSLLKYRLLTNETIDLEWFFTFLNRRLWTYSFHFNFHFREKAIPNRKKMNFTIFVGDRQFTNDNNLPLDEVCLGLIQFESIWYELLFSCKSFIKMWPKSDLSKKVHLYGPYDLQYIGFKVVFTNSTTSKTIKHYSYYGFHTNIKILDVKWPSQFGLHFFVNVQTSKWSGNYS